MQDYAWREISDGKKYDIHCPLCTKEWPIDVLQRYGGIDEKELHLLEEGLSKNFCEQNMDLTTCPGEDCDRYCTRIDSTINSM